MTKRNPKQEGSRLFDAKPQSGPCPLDCNQCFYNRPGAFYVPIDEPHMPTLEEVGDGIVRVNCGHDSNIRREDVIAATAIYKRRFFNTSVPRFDFPGPVVYTANSHEEKPAHILLQVPADNLMFVRLRVSSTNLIHIDKAISIYTATGVTVVLTFMAYYDAEPRVPDDLIFREPCYEWKVRHVNSYWCPTPAFMQWVMSRYKDNRLVTMCGTPESVYCRDCLNCETYFVQTEKRMRINHAL